MSLFPKMSNYSLKNNNNNKKKLYLIVPKINKQNKTWPMTCRKDNGSLLEMGSWTDLIRLSVLGFKWTPAVHYVQHGSSFTKVDYLSKGELFLHYDWQWGGLWTTKPNCLLGMKQCIQCNVYILVIAADKSLTQVKYFPKSTLVYALTIFH